MKDKPLEGLLVVSDIDNTLWSEAAGFPEANRRAIRRFCELGGYFTVATGRNMAAVRQVIREIGINAPAILNGGGLIYDYARDIALGARYLPAGARTVMRQMMQAFPTLGFEVTGEDMQVYVVQAAEGTAHHLAVEHFDGFWADLDKVEGRWLKALTAGPPALCAAAQRWSKRYDGDKSGITFLRTQDIYFELLPAGVNKGTGLGSLCRILGVRPENTFAIGDYDNDLELLDAAGFAVAVANATPQVRRRADLVTGRCEEGGVAQFLNALIEQRTGGAV